VSSHASETRPLTATSGTPLRGRLRPPGDKSISHRAMIFGLLTVGTTRVTGLLEGEDVMRTAAAARALGATITRDADAWVV
jgi:3-phosphoshikimate 1-carboxyvinyltransferase